MITYRISKCRYINDLSGFGAFTYGGRWNSKGVHILYTAGSISLALLEVLAHTERPLPLDFCRIALEIPDELVLDMPKSKLRADWNKSLPPDELKIIGDSFIASGSHLALRVPSAIVDEEHNYLINVRHPEMRKLKILMKSLQRIDGRLV